MLDIYKVDSFLLNNKEFIDSNNIRAIEIAGMKLIDKKIHQFTPRGLTGIYLLAESHLSFHTWPEKNFISIDLYTCGDVDKCFKGIQFL